MKKWLKAILSCLLCVITAFGVLAGCSVEEEDDGYCTVTFDLCTDLETNRVLPKEVLKGDTVAKPIVAVQGENPKNSEVEGWYRDKDYTQPWIFLTDAVEEDITLYAKWVNKFDVFYYLGDETETFMYKEQHREGSLITPNYALADGFRSDGFFADPEYTTKFDFTKPIEGNTNIYIHRSDEFYFSASMIANRFVPMAAPSGTGSTTGNIELVKDGEEEYAKVNFGYSTATDAHIMLQYVTVDISHSKKIKFTMKNVGKADRLKIYFVSWYDNETKEFVEGEGFGESRAFTYTYAENQKNMKPEDDWAEIEIDLAGKVQKDGVSLWGESATLLKLRIDSCYISESPDDLSNELWIKSIEGVKDPNYKPLEDSAEIKALLKDDDAAAVEAAAAAQEDVVGFIFPKDNAAASCVASEDGKNFVSYKKTNGLLLYTPFRTKNAQVAFKASADEKINLYDNTTLVLRLANYGYAKTIRLIWKNNKGRTGSSELTISSEMTGVQDLEFNMVGAAQWKETLDTLTIEYDAVGVDNAILIESIQFKPYRMVTVPGFNFDDRNVFGVEDSAAMKATFSATDYATEFNVINAADAVVEKDFSTYANYTNVGYKALVLNYKQTAEGITKVNVTLTVDGEDKTYAFEVGVAEKITAVEVPLEKTGNVTKFKMTFEGTGEIVIKSVRFKADENTSVDFGTTTQYSRMKADSTWSVTLSYDSGMSAAVLGACTQLNPSKFYFGVTKGAVSNGNFSLEDKTKVVIVYYNPGKINQFVVGLGFTDITEDDSWTEAVTEAGSTGSGGVMHVDLEKDMKAGEWAVAEIPLSSFKSTENLAEKALTMLSFSFHDNEKDSSDNLYIRLITIV